MPTSNFMEVLMVNTMTTALMSNLDEISSVFKLVLIVTAIIYNISKIHGWMQGMRKSPLEENKD